MWRLVPTLVAQMGSAYPELQRAEALIGDTLLTEETRFRVTLARASRSSTRKPRVFPPAPGFRARRPSSFTTLLAFRSI